MNNNITSDAPRQELEEVEVMGRTVYVSQQNEKAYVEYGDGLVSMTDLQAWNTLMEEAKKKSIEGYEKKSFSEKQLADKTDYTAEKLLKTVRELDHMAQRLKEFP